MAYTIPANLPPRAFPPRDLSHDNDLHNHLNAPAPCELEREGRKRRVPKGREDGMIKNKVLTFHIRGISRDIPIVVRTTTSIEATTASCENRGVERGS